MMLWLKTNWPWTTQGKVLQILFSTLKRMSEVLEIDNKESVYVEENLYENAQ
jgi:hypothetical protein